MGLRKLAGEAFEEPFLGHGDTNFDSGGQIDPLARLSALVLGGQVGVGVKDRLPSAQRAQIEPGYPRHLVVLLSFVREAAIGHGQLAVRVPMPDDDLLFDVRLEDVLAVVVLDAVMNARRPGRNVTRMAIDPPGRSRSLALASESPWRRRRA